MGFDCVCSPIFTDTTPDTTEQLGCGFDHSGLCTGKCDKPNSRCGDVQSYDMIFPCDCIYCYYDSEQKQCTGQCEHKEYSQCVSQVKNPQNVTDCACYRCKTEYDQSTGNTICSGQPCLGSSLICKATKFQTMIGYEYVCTCQSPDYEEPPQTECRYRPHIGCAGICESGSECMTGELGFDCVCSPIFTDTTPDTTEQLGCGFDHSGLCTGKCDKPNSRCGDVQSYDMIFPCDCIYCYYDSEQKQCTGQCEHKEYSQCVSQVKNPQNVTDCACYRCKTEYDQSTGNTICSGQPCLGSSLICKATKFQTMIGYEYVCTCQSPD